MITYTFSEDIKGIDSIQQFNTQAEADTFLIDNKIKVSGSGDGTFNCVQKGYYDLNICEHSVTIAIT